MADNINDTAPTRVTTRSSTAAAAAAAAAANVAVTTTRTTMNKNGHDRLAQLYPQIRDDIRLPSKWNGKEKAQTLVLHQNDLVVTYKGNIDKRTLPNSTNEQDEMTFVGPGKSHKDAASVRSDYPIPPLTGIYYFEVKIVSKGRDG
jgi:hypothetical protein